MPPLNLRSVTLFVEQNIREFHISRLAKLHDIRLKDVLRAKNPYLFKAKNVTTANEIIGGILSAYLSSSEEGAFGNWLERLAIFVNDSVYNGRKGLAEGIDLDFDKDGIRYLVAIKSGPNWGNDSQIKKMLIDFNTAKRRARTSGARGEIVCVNGCCYGRTSRRYEHKRSDYYKFSGQRFWEFISNEENLYKDLIEPLGHEAQERNDEFIEMYGALLNRLSREFLENYCLQDGRIDWNKWLEFNSQTVA